MQLLAAVSLLGFLAFTGVQGAVLVASPSDATAYSHDIHSMICVAFGNPAPQITWSKSGSGTINPQNEPTFYVNNTIVTTSDGTPFFVSILTFCALRIADAGTYSCSVQSAANDQYSFLNGMQSASFSLSVTTRPPELGSFSMDMDHGRLSLSFTKPLNITTFKPVFTLQNAASNPSASYTLINNQPQSTVDTGFILIVLTPTDLDNLKATRSLFTGMSDSYLSFTTGGTRDLNGVYLLPIGMDEAVQVMTYTADFQRPLVISVDVFDLDRGAFDITFSEAIDPDSLDIGRITLQNTLNNPSTSYTLLGGAAATIGTPRNIRITMSLSDSAEVKILPGIAKNVTSTFVSFWDDAIADFANNRLLAAKFDVGSFVPDSSPAGLSCFSLDLNSGTVQLSFNDVVSQSSLIASSIRLQSSQSATNGYQLMDRTLADGTTLYIQTNISKSTLIDIKSDAGLGTTVNNTYISATQGFIRDIYGVQSLEVSSTNALQACQIYPDTIPPTAISFTLDLNQGELRVTFNEPVSPSSYTPAMIRFMSGSTNLPVLSGGTAYTVMGNKLAVRVKLSATDLQNIHDNPNIGLPAQANMTSLQLSSGAFSDYASNPLALTNLNAQMVVPDTSPPTLSGFTLNLVTGQFFLTFSEPITISDQQQFISSISITDSPTSPMVSLTAANSPNDIMFAMPTSNTVTLTLPDDLHQLIDDSSLIATSASNVHISFDASNGVTDLVGQQLAAGFTQASGIVRLCVNNTYNSVADGTCESCLSVCRDGCTGPNPTLGSMGCTRCEVLQVDSSNKPVRCFNPSDGCPVGTYRTSDGQTIQPFQTYLSGADRSVCLPCHPLCAQCTGSSSTACSACSHAAVKLQTGVMCLDSCINNNNCYYCDDQCNGCRNNATDCIACKNDMMIWQGRRLCIPTCDTTTQFLRISPSGNSECAACDSQCSSMGCTGSLNSDCKSCKSFSQYTSDGSRRVMCVDSCPNGYYANASMFCLPCFQNCKRCNGPDSSQCTVCTFEDDSVNRVSFVNCQKSCPTGYTLDVVGGDCDLIVAVWLVPLLLLLIIGAVIGVLLIVGFVCLRTSKTKATKGISDQEDFSHHIDNPVYSTSKDTVSLKSDFES